MINRLASKEKHKRNHMWIRYVFSQAQNADNIELISRNFELYHYLVRSRKMEEFRDVFNNQFNQRRIQVLKKVKDMLEKQNNSHKDELKLTIWNFLD